MQSSRGTSAYGFGRPNHITAAATSAIAAIK
jgi:hypothetical protein